MPGKAGRPPVSKQTKNEVACMEYYLNWKSAIFTAKQLNLNPHTVEKYFQKFRAKTIEEKNDDFIARQRMAKNQCLAKLDEMIDYKEKQISRFNAIVKNDNTTDTADESQRFEVNFSKLTTDLATLYQQKADLEMTETLDIKVDELVREKYEEFTSNKDS